MKKEFDSQTESVINECSTAAESVESVRLSELTKVKTSVRRPTRKGINKFKNWGREDTRRFFRSLEMFGTDFYMINQLFKDRTRTQLKRKYKKERDSNELAASLKKSRRTKFLRLKERLVDLREQHKGESGPLSQFIRQRFGSLASVDSLDIELVEELKHLA